MLPFFPTPYPDETLYSLFARYSVYTGSTYLNTVQELIGIRNSIRDANMLGYIENLHTKISGIGLTAEDLIFKHTAYPFIAPFQTNAIRKEIMETMLNKGSKTVTIFSNIVRFNKYLQHCSKCIEEDMDKYGETYWRRIHQMPGVFVCPTHNKLLMKTKEYIPYHNFIIPSNEGIYVETYDIEVDNITFRKLKKYSNEIMWLLNNNFMEKFDALNDKIKNKMKENGYYLKNNTINRKKLSLDVLNYYGNSTLKFFNSTIENKGGWITSFLNKHQRTSVTKYILIIIFLWDTMKSFVDDTENKIVINKNGGQIKSNPFDEGPWPCLNPACENYYKDVIKDITVKRSNKTKKMFAV